MPFLNSNCVSSCHLTNKRQSAAIRLGNAGPDNINNVMTTRVLTLSAGTSNVMTTSVTTMHFSLKKCPL